MMQRIAWLAILFAVSMLGWSPAADAQKRVALVIGNGAYTKVPRLDNPKNDAAAMEAMLKAAGFDAVVRANDLGVVAMRRALRDFSDTAHYADVAVVFYAGHGIEVGGINYLIPTDAVLERDIDARDEAIPLDRVNEILEPVKRLRLVILDACRDNPFARSMRRTIATRQVRSGYGEIDERSLPPNTLVAYAQRAGLTAEDGVGSSNSPFTTALIKHLPTPGLDIELALRRVRDEVLRTTKNRQEPFKYGSLSGVELPLVSASTGGGAAAFAKPVDGGTAKQLSEAAEAWGAAERTTSIAALEAYVARYKETFYAELARARIEELKKADAERQRLALLQKQEDDRKRPPATAAKSAVLVIPAKASLGTLVRKFERAHEAEATSVAVSTDGRFIVSGGDRTVKVWEPATGRLVRTLTGSTDGVTSVAVAPDWSWVAGASYDSIVRLWNPTSGDLMHALKGHTAAVTNLAVSPDGRYLMSSSDDKTVRVWNPATGQQIRTLEHSTAVRTIAVSPDGKSVYAGLLYCGNSGGLNTPGMDHTIWDIESGRPLQTFGERCSRMLSVAVSADPIIATADYNIRWWGQQGIRREGQYGSYAYSILISPRGKWILAGGVEFRQSSVVGSIKVWEANTGRLEKTFDAHGDTLIAMAVSPDGRWLVSAGCERYNQRPHGQPAFCLQGDLNIWALE